MSKTSRFVVFIGTLLCLFMFGKSHAQHVAVCMVPPENADHVTVLNTPWSFYWKKNYQEYQQDTSLVSELIDIPSSWTEHGYPERGYALFVLRVCIPGSAGTPLAVKVPTVTTAFNFYVDGVKMANGGHVSTNVAEIKADYQPQVVFFTAKSDTVELAFEVGNKDYRVAGVDYPVAIGKPDVIHRNFNGFLYFAAFVSGALLIMFFYFLGFYLVRARDLTALYFSLMCVVSSLRIISTDAILLRQLNVPISWSWLVNIELSSIILIPVFGGMYLYHLLHINRFKVLLYTFNAISSLMVVFILIAPTYYDSWVVPAFRYYVSVQMFFILFVVARQAWIQKNNLSIIAFAAYVAVFSAGVNDILYSMVIIDTFFMLPYAILFYVLIQTTLMSRYIGFELSKVEVLSQRLALTNKNQEKLIEQRTAELHEQSEHLKHYNEVKDKIMSIIAHDLRSPIASLSSVITLAEIGDKDDLETIRTFFKSVKPHIDNLNLTIDNLFVWAHNQINGNAIAKNNLSLNAVVARVLPLYDLVATQKEIKLVNQAKDPFVVVADNSYLELVLRNLVSNALKFTKAGGEVRITSQVVDKSFVEVAIHDNGVGIKPEDVAKIFNRETHFTTYGTNNEKGTGLGLRLCEDYIRFNGGEIHIDSEFGIGTTIRFTLPLSNQ